jgi:hypothetical protein
VDWEVRHAVEARDTQVGGWGGGGEGIGCGASKGGIGGKTCEGSWGT